MSQTSAPGDGSRMGEGSRWRQVLDLGVQLLARESEQGAGVSARPAAGILSQRDLIVRTASRVLQAQARLWLSDELFTFATGTRPPKQAAGEQTSAPERRKRAGGSSGKASGRLSPLMRRAMENQQLCYQEAGDGQPYRCDGALPEAARAVAAPLLTFDAETQGRVLMGVMQVERPEGPAFSGEDIELLDGLSAQAALALQADRQMAVERWRVEQLALVRDVSAQVAETRDLETLTRQVTRLILERFNYYFVAIFTLEPGAGVLHFRASCGPWREGDQPGEAEAGFQPLSPILIGEGIVGTVAQDGAELLAEDVSAEPRYRYSDSLPETRAEVALPLKIEDRVLGVLDVQSDQANSFHMTDMLVLRALAGNIAIALEGARLYEALDARAAQLSAVAEVSNAIASILDQDDLLQEVVNLIHKRFGYPFVHIFSVHPGRRKIFYEAGSGELALTLLEEGYAFDLDDPQGMIPWVARHGETLLANDVEREPLYRNTALPPANPRSELAVPLIYGSEVLAVLDVQSERLDAFGEEDRFLFEALADSIAVALRNASLYRSELWRRQVAESLREVAGLLSADVDLDKVLNAILEELERNLPCDLAAIWLLDEDAGASGETSAPTPLQLAAARGKQAANLVLQPGGIQVDLPVPGNAPAPQADLQQSRWLREALEADEPLIRQAQTPGDGSEEEGHDEPLSMALGFSQDYSAIAAPLRVGEQRLGVLVLAHHLPRRYGSEARSMTAAFASYASAAIENTRLYEAAHEQAWVSTVLLQVADATQTLTNLNELLATVVRITPMLIGVRACALYVLDEGEAFVPAAAYGLSPEGQAEFERWRFAPGDVPAFDRLIEVKHSLILHGEASDTLLSAIMSASTEGEQPDGGELQVLVPLISRGEVQGAMLVDYGNAPTAPESLEELEAIFDERLAILQGIAHQTAVAVENIRLNKAQKDEAYVSVALLQVAQAVVSSNDLDEILGSIVRITPILVGVKRAIIYLWNAEHQVFRLVEAYGIPREWRGKEYTPAEFPLLEATRQWNTLMAYPLDIGEEEETDFPEVWRTFPPPDLDEVDDLLDSGECLLLAIPLAARGQVLGVMLVEEPERASRETFTGSERRLRERRLEITTGISQQAALAIQNDQLQREMVERERLEREFQLAREIQRTFMPDRIPDLPGWELDMRWRTAREVGGDFYDFFELPGERLGLVIADVADKGMPAALFMTLIRTLVRATVQSVDSPGQVLERVNEVLVPDAREGMFVTIFYGVVSLSDGELVYANAGHNPPLLVHAQSGEMEVLERGGMALGVMENTHIGERVVRIAPGDYLFLYTDGITESFAADGAMFGETELQRVVRSAGQGDCAEAQGRCSAGEILDRVEAALSQFLGGRPLSDDLTLLALRRGED